MAATLVLMCAATGSSYAEPKILSCIAGLYRCIGVSELFLMKHQANQFVDEDASRHARSFITAIYLQSTRKASQRIIAITATTASTATTAITAITAIYPQSFTIESLQNKYVFAA